MSVCYLGSDPEDSVCSGVFDWQESSRTYGDFGARFLGGVKAFVPNA